MRVCAPPTQTRTPCPSHLLLPHQTDPQLTPHRLGIAPQDAQRWPVPAWALQPRHRALGRAHALGHRLLRQTGTGTRRQELVYQLALQAQRLIGRLEALAGLDLPTFNRNAAWSWRTGVCFYSVIPKS